MVFYIRELKGLRDYTMAQNFLDFVSRYLRLGVVLCLSIALLAHATNAPALTRAELYQATVPVTERSEPAQAAAFQAALRIVLVRVTGRRAADEDPVFAPLITNASRYVQQYRKAADNQLLVSFDGAAIERWLTQNGQPLWGHERPSTFVWLAVQGASQGGGVVTADDSSELKAAVDAAASLRGTPLLWPSAADASRNHVDYSTLASLPASALSDGAHQRGADAVLIGRATNATALASVRWTLLFQDRSSEFSGAAAEGVNRAADTFAGLFAASGNSVPIEIEVAGVSDLRSYASLEAYLESLDLVSHVDVEALSGDAVRFRLSTRGGADALQHVLTLNGRLQSIEAGANGLQRYQLHR